MKPAGRLGLLGGTFDPIHLGHLDVADTAARTVGLDSVLFVPAHDPPHRATVPRASVFHRFAMVALAIDTRPHYRVSDLELMRPGPSYSSDTLRYLHGQGWDRSQLFFILGSDAFAEISTWHEFPTVLDFAHFVVVSRPGAAVNAAIDGIPGLEGRLRPEGQPGRSDGKTEILLVDAETHPASSTAVRLRLSKQQPIDDLVPPAVARHIYSHQLYGAVSELHGQDADRQHR
jgi:nicotinate-nucleotide adenylyltransferase